MKLPFDDLIVGDKSEKITNQFSGESVELKPEAVAVYDLIKGAEMLGLWETMNKGLDWFAENYPKEYMILLD